MDTKNKAPWQIILISLIDFIAAFFSNYLTAALFFSLIFSKFGEGTISLIVALTLRLSFFLFFIITGTYLWKGKNWARITQIIVLIFFSIFSIIFVDLNDDFIKISLPTILVSLIIVGYLLFNKNAKEHFKK